MPKTFKLQQNNWLSRPLWWLIGGRLITFALLLSAAASLTNENWLLDDANSGALARGTLPILLAVIVLSFAYALALRFSSLPLRLQIGIQFFFDVGIVTWMVWATGDVRSPYASLYIVVISFASIFLRARSALVTSVGCGLVYTLVMLLCVTGVLPSESARAVVTDASRAQAIQVVGLNTTAFFVVGLLAARWAERHSRSEATTHALASLRALHERIVESIGSGVITTDVEGRIYSVNRAGEEITGYAAANLSGQDASILFGDLAERIEASMNAARNGEARPRFEANCLMAEGTPIRLGFSISQLTAENESDLTGLVITFQDLTQVRALEEASRRQDRLAAVGRVSAGIAHEIRNPLASMRGAIQVLRADTKAESSEAELMEIILRESDRLDRIITDFLIYARPRAISLEDVDVRESLHETFTLLRHSPEIHEQHLIEEDLTDEPVRARVDVAQMRQVFWNLARNSLQAMPEGGTLQATLRHAPFGRVRITFTDSGDGMSPDQVERLFEPFASTRAGGTGLGLSIVYQIIREHDGTINVRSREGDGTTITIELPSAK